MRTTLAAALTLIVCSGCYTEVAPGSVGVPVVWSETQQWTYPPGFHWHQWIGMNVVPMSTRTETYDMGASQGAGASQQVDAPPIEVQSSDQLTFAMDITVQFRLNAGAAPRVYDQLGLDYERRIIRPAVRAGVREAASQFTAVETVTRRRQIAQAMTLRVRERVGHTLSESGLPRYSVVVVDVIARNIRLPESIQESIARVQQQRQRAEERTLAIQTQRQEAERARIEAQQRADVRLTEARAEAESNRLIAESLTPRVLESRRIDALRAVLESDQTRTILLPGGSEGGGGILLNLPSQ